MSFHSHIEMDNAVIGDFPGVTFGFHLCRGNQASRWLASGGYERIARIVFRRVRAQRLLLEYDDARSGSFEPLKEVPEDKWEWGERYFHIADPDGHELSFAKPVVWQGFDPVTGKLRFG